MYKKPLKIYIIDFYNIDQSNEEHGGETRGAGKVDKRCDSNGWGADWQARRSSSTIEMNYQHVTRSLLSGGDENTINWPMFALHMEAFKAANPQN